MQKARATHAEPHPIMDRGWIVQMTDGTVRYLYADSEREALRVAPASPAPFLTSKEEEYEDGAAGIPTA
ncbi:MAG: hypothetical protein ACRDGH_13350 [Candidatus Limnocylindria bacterium]